MQPIETSYNIELEDMLALSENYITNNKQFKRLFLFLKFLFPIIVGIYIIIDLFRHRLSITLITTSVTISVVWIAFIPRFMMRNILKRVKKSLEQGNNKQTLGLHVVRFNLDGFDVKKMDVEVNSNWDALLKVVQTPEYFFLYDSENSALVIPKHKLGEQRAAVTDFLESKFPNIISKKA